MVGEPFDFELERELQQEMTPQFMLYTKSDSVSLLAASSENVKPVLKMKVNFDGLGLMVMQRNAAYIDETPAAFKKYLEEEHIDGITFDSLKWKKPVVKEKYSRCLKSLVTSGKPGNENLYSKIVGQRLEILLTTNPYLLTANQRVVAKVLWEGKPLASQWITASCKSNKTDSLKEISVLTDKAGIAGFEVDFNTICYLHTIYMLRLKNDAKADYESVWASYSFQTAER